MIMGTGHMQTDFVSMLQVFENFGCPHVMN